MDERPELELRHYLNVLRRRYAVVVLVAVLAVGAALAFDFTSTRIYAASADVLLTDTQQSTVFSNGQVTTADPTRRLDTQVTVMESRPIASAVNHSLGADAGKVSTVSVAGIGQTDVIEATVESPDPGVAKRAADLYAKTYVATRRTQQVDSLLAAANEVQKKLTQIQFQINALDPKTAGAQIVALTAQYGVFKQQLDQIQVNAAVQSGGAQVVANAVVPSSPVKPQPIRDTLLAGVLGLLLGIGLAFLAEYLDDRINTSEDVARYGHGLTVLAEVPAVSGWRDRKITRVVSLQDPRSSATEAYRSLRTSLQIIGLRRPIQTILVTSPMAVEGKTTTAANLAVTMARAGRRVVLVDLDLRRPRLDEFFGVDREPGITSVLVGDKALSEALNRVAVADGVPPVVVLTSGPIPPNPAELMGTTRVSELLGSLQSTADLIIIDSPPLIPVTDALVLSGLVDGVLLVVGAGQTRRRHLGRAADLLQQTEAPVLGAVLNATTAQRHKYGYGYGYGRYGYSEDKGPKRKALSRT
jgi:polysaccharide biosynthesis transport protein